MLKLERIGEDEKRSSDDVLRLIAPVIKSKYLYCINVMERFEMIAQLVFDYPSEQIGGSVIVQADCLQWLTRVSENSLHAVVTDPPYGVKEYDFEQIAKRENGNGGIWRIPPSFDGHQRSPLPRFTALTQKERAILKCFFVEWAKLVVCVLRPGGHVFIASNAFLSQLVFSALIEGGLEFRIVGDEGIVTGMRNLSRQELDNLGRRYGFNPN